MKDKLLAAAQEAVQEIVETMLFMEIEQGASGDGPSGQPENYSAVVGYSQSLEGSMRLSAPKSGALKIAGALMGEEAEEMDAEMQDGFAEMANMIAGGVQVRVQDELGEISISPPIVVHGENYDVEGATGFACIHQIFQLEGEPFYCEITFDPSLAGDEPEPVIERSEDEIRVEALLNGSVEGMIQEIALPQVRQQLPGMAERVIREEMSKLKA
uniref:Chemotaxis phosphatase CheX-like domain-containing protein n=1 Tax=Magnetococcus massalia (strain MO-1) TaxID=451514 RepID=A0A1S7LEQ9_MAGMO|nr:Conserved protein of unknown function. Containing inhibitor of MCP methylation-like protein. Containing chemotaxis protein CheX domain [Candidatus Magnetococcus massalia]